MKLTALVSIFCLFFLFCIRDSKIIESDDRLDSSCCMPELNMEMVYTDIEYCGGQQIIFDIITRYNFPNLGGLEQCATGNGLAFLFHSITYNFEVEITDNGDASNNQTLSFSHNLDQNYITNNTSPATAVSLGNGFSIYFADTSWTCTSGCLSTTDDSIYLNSNYLPFIGECDSDYPRRNDAPFNTYAQPNFRSVLIYDVPAAIVGPGTIDFDGTNESGITVFSAQAFGGFYQVVPQTAPAEANVNSNGAGITPELDLDDPGDCGPLFIHLTKFDGTAEKNEAILQWEIVASEPATVTLENSGDGDSYKSVQKWQYDGMGYYVIEEEFVHKDPLDGYNFYRIKMEKENGEVSYSKMVSLYFDRENGSKLDIYPNPVSNMLTIESTSSFTRLELLSLDGRLLLSNHVEPINTQELDVSRIEPGAYILRIITQDKTLGRKIIVQ